MRLQRVKSSEQVMSSKIGPTVEALSRESGIRSFLKDLGWRETEEWVWKRETSGKFLALQKTNSRFVGSLTAWILWRTA